MSLTRKELTISAVLGIAALRLKGTGGRAAFLALIVLIIRNLIRRLAPNTVPTPSTILQMGPTTSHVPTENSAKKAGSTSSNKADLDAAAALCKLLDRQVLQGRQQGVQISVFRDGEQVLSVCSGVYRTRTSEEWQPVTPETRFMPWSVSKGMAAAALLSCVDEGLIDYTQPVADVWPAFAAKGKHSLSVQDAVSHRIDTTGLPTLAMLYNSRKDNDMKGLWERGLLFVEQDTPPPPERNTPSAMYVPVSWSWVMGGIVQGACEGKHIRDVVRDALGKPLGMEEELMLGCFPSGHAAEPLLVKAQMPRARPLLLPRGVRDVLTLGWARRVAAYVESAVLVNAANSDFIRLHCLPSSNGFFTARAVAKVYAALANDGKVGDVQLFSQQAVDNLVASVADVTKDAVSPRRPNKPARLSRGFNPWSNTALHGKNARTVLGHSGICGSTAFADPKSGLSVAIFHTVYQPLLAAHPVAGIGEATLEISQTIQKAYGLDVEA